MNSGATSSSPPPGSGGALSRALLAVCLVASVGALALLALLCANHVGMPLHLEIMEGTILQHFERAAAGEPVYPAPSPDFVPLVYNVLYYYASVPLGWLLGIDLVTLRLMSILGVIGIALVLFGAVQQRSGSRAWGLIAVGLFAAAYHTMDAYLDTAHADSWMLFMAVLGTWIVGRSRTRATGLLGVAILVLAFWFKQHGALFAIGGVLFLTWRDGPRKSWPYWVLAIVAGPLLWLLAGPALFGSHYHYFTLDVPRQWSTLDRHTIQRLVEYFVGRYPLLLMASLWLMVRGLCRGRERLDVWSVQLLFAALTAFLGSLDAGSSNNVFNGLGLFLVLAGTLGLSEMGRSQMLANRPALVLLAVLISFVPHGYDPRRLWVSPQAEASYADLIEVLRGLDGPVYSPTTGYLSSDFDLHPRAHWVCIDDMVRGPGREVAGHPIVAQMLAPALHPEGPAYVLTRAPLDGWFAGMGLAERYRLRTDFGERFQPLQALPHRWHHLGPRYLFEYVGEAGAQDQEH